MDGNTAAAHVAYAFSEVAAIYPITPSSVMGELADAWAARGRKNIFGQTLKVTELQSEAGAAGAIHGSLSAGALTTTFTASQGLMLMLPNMHKIAGELLPTVFHVTARTLATHSLSIFGDHSDVMSARSTGFAMLASASPQEVMDLGTIAHLASIKSSLPFLHFFDGFRTSHVINKVETVDYDILAAMYDHEAMARFKARSLNPEHPMAKVGAQNPDVFFQGREAANRYYDALPGIVKDYMRLYEENTGRAYHLFDYIGAPDAEKIIIIMGSAGSTAEEYIKSHAAEDHKIGMIKVRLYRPFSAKDLVATIPRTVKKIAVLDRTKEPGSPGEPLYLDVRSALYGSGINIIGARYGLSSKEFTPSMVHAVFKHLHGKYTHSFTVGINDDVTHLSIPVGEHINSEPDDAVLCKFWGYGSDGTVGANKNAIKIVGENTDLYAQGYFQYDSKKSGGITVSHLRFSKQPILSEYLLDECNFVALHKSSYIGRYDILKGIEKGGIFLINSKWDNDQVFQHLTRKMQQTIIDKKIKVYNINAVKIASEVGLGEKISTIMQIAFFKVVNIMPMEQALEQIKGFIHKTFAKKGEKLVQMNCATVDMALDAVQEVPIPREITESAPDIDVVPAGSTGFVKNVIDPALRFNGDVIPVSEMPVDGMVQTGTTSLEKRGVAISVPIWDPEFCIQCNFCSLVCPHAAIRAKQVEPEKIKDAPEDFVTLKSITKNTKDLRYRIQVYPEDCVGCGSCANTCPGKKGQKALTMVPHSEVKKEGKEQKNAEFFEDLPYITEGARLKTPTGSQFLRPYFEFSGACAGCGETPYIKLATQLFGDRMIIANATGCSSIYGGTFPTIPYCKDEKGHGPAWGNSLFEDNAEYAYGMRLAVDSNRGLLKELITEALTFDLPEDLESGLKRCIEMWNAVDGESKKNAAGLKKLLSHGIESLTGPLNTVLKDIKELEEFFIEKSVWAVGGDGWAYDIGFGGVDHVLASGRNVNILVLDTEVYSNTGGQASKATSIAARAKFAETGKELRKKDLGFMMMGYGYVYVASVSMGANRNQTLKALMEAEEYNGPSIVICYSPCIAHGVDMSRPQDAMKRAVESGHWPLYRFDPRLIQKNKNPLQFDSRDFKIDYSDFIMKERRFSSLKSLYPERAKKLYAKAETEDREHYLYLRKLSKIEPDNE